jgi:hypothetical protein
MDVRGGTVATRPEPSPRDDELVAVAEDLDTAIGRVADDLTAARL